MLAARSETPRTAEPPDAGPGGASIDEAFALAALPGRDFGAHKWGVGGVVIVGGSPQFVGAPALAAVAAGRAGAGIVNVAVPRSLVGAIAPTAPEAGYVLIPESESAGGGRRAAELIGAKLEKSAALVIGPGLGDDEAATALLAALFGTASGKARIGFGFGGGAGTEGGAGGDGASVVASGKPMVIDADGLNWLAKQEAWPSLLPPRSAVLTPHVGEMTRLLGLEDATPILADPVGTAQEAASRWGQVVLLKYGYAAVSDGERTLVAEDAPASLATGGTGDVLAGTIGGLLAQGVAPMEAAGLAVYLGCRAARRVERLTGVLGLLAGDLPAGIGQEIAVLEERRRAGG